MAIAPEVDRNGTAALVDSFGRKHTYLRVSVTDRCNFRCQYCMPEEEYEWAPREEILTYEEIERVVRALASVGVTKVRLTGGEPTVRRGIEGLIGAVSRIPGIESVCMTTNGSTLAKKARVYRAAGLDVLNVSLDTLRKDRFREITQTDHFDRVMAGIDAALSAGFEPLKINVVAMRGVNEDELCDFVEFVRERPINVRFIEFMPFDGNAWTRGKLLPFATMLSSLRERYVLTPLDGKPSDVAKNFHVEGCRGTVSFITSMTNDFCGGCNRIRLTVQGEIKPCLFMPASHGLRDKLRAGATDEDIIDAVRGSLAMKWRGHPGSDNLLHMKNASMVQIGG